MRSFYVSALVVAFELASRDAWCDEACDPIAAQARWEAHYDKAASLAPVGLVLTAAIGAGAIGFGAFLVTQHDGSEETWDKVIVKLGATEIVLGGLLVALSGVAAISYPFTLAKRPWFLRWSAGVARNEALSPCARYSLITEEAEALTERARQVTRTTGWTFLGIGAASLLALPTVAIPSLAEDEQIYLGIMLGASAFAFGLIGALAVATASNLKSPTDPQPVVAALLPVPGGVVLGVRSTY